MSHNPYETLGVSNTASIDEIKEQFRKLALIFHPDKSKSQNSETKFKEISEAYEILSDPIKRVAYDKESNSKKEEKKPNPTESARSVWWRQLKTMSRELLRLFQKYAQAMNEKQKSYQTKQAQNFGYNRKIDEFGESYFGDFPYESKKVDNFVDEAFRYEKPRKKSNFEDPWIATMKDDAKLANDIFGVEKPRKKHKGRRNYDYGFNIEDVFDL